MKHCKIALFAFLVIVAQGWAQSNCQDDNPALGLPAGSCYLNGALVTVLYVTPGEEQYLRIDMAEKVDSEGKIDPTGKPIVIVHYADPERGTDALSMMMLGSMSSAALINDQPVRVIYKKDNKTPGVFFLTTIGLY